MTSTESTQSPPPLEGPRYAELARRLIEERADLFRVVPPRALPRVVQVRPSGAGVAPSARRARRGQLMLPLRPRLLNGRDTVSS